MLLASPNESFSIAAVTADGRTDLYGKAEIYNLSNTLVNTVNLNHIANGLYTGTTSLATEGKYNIVTYFFVDIARTIPAGYSQGGESLDIDSWKTNILRLLGLTHENSVIDQHVTNLDGNTLSARIRVYDTASNANAAYAALPGPYVTGLRFQYTVTSSYNGKIMQDYKLIRDV